MVYNHKLIAVLSINGRILRERQDADGTPFVFIPFGAEYSLQIKNENSRDCVIKVSIDGQDVLDGYSIIVRANSGTTLEGFLKGNRVTNKFKFIQKTNEIADHRGDRIDDGIVRIEYRFEKRKEVTITSTHHHYDVFHRRQCSQCYNSSYHCVDTICPWFNGRFNLSPTMGMCDTVSYGATGGNIGGAFGGNIGSGNFGISRDIRRSAKSTVTASVSAMSCSQDFSRSISEQSVQPLQDEGITVKGSSTNQSFNFGQIGELEENSETIIIRMKGETSKGKKIEEPITVKTNLVCETCGKSNSSSSKFCDQCGTSLI